MKRFAVLLTFFVFAFASLQAQNVQITGTVTGDDGSRLPGVSVVVKGTTVGTVTDVNGQYELMVPEDATTLVFSFVGMRTMEVPIDNNTTISVTMESDVFGLDEVLVVAYGTQLREAKTGAVGVVEGETLKDIPETSLDKMLEGKVAGVDVSTASGQPGGDAQIRIRGISSILAGNQPLYVIDGVPVMQGDQTYFTNTGNALSSLNPNDIKSISILKDAAAASVYGSRAANGVILITTKSGEAGKSKVTFRTSYGAETMANDNDYGTMPYNDWIDYNRFAAENAGLDPDAYYPLSLKDSSYTDWLDELTRTGSIYNAELAFEGGNEKTTHYVSGNYNKHQGAFQGIEYEKYQARVNIDHQAKDWLKVGTRINAAHIKSEDVAMQSLYYVNPIFAGMAMSPTDKIYNEDGTFNFNTTNWANTNPLANLKYDDQWEKQNRFNGNLYLDIQLLEGLSFRTTNSYEMTEGEGRRYWAPEADPTMVNDAGDPYGILQVSRTRYDQMTTSNVLTYQKLFGEHNVQVLLGQEATKYDNNSYYIYSPDVNPSIPFPSTGTSDADDADYDETGWTLASYFSVFNYGYASKYYLQASVRTDGSSRFGSDTKWGQFWAIGASWNLHNEDFMDNIAAIDQLKLRANYGTSGNNRIGDYDQYGTYATVQYNGVSGMAPARPANPDLGWEMNVEANIGVDFTLYDRVSGTVDVYQRNTEDMLLEYPLSRTSGFASVQTNIGEVQNRGIEFMMDFRVVDAPEFTWNLGFNLAHNKSEILDLGKDEEFISPLSNRLIHRVGESLYSFYLYDYAGVNPANGEALWYTEDGTLTNKYANARQFIAGTPEPDLIGGINTFMKYKGFSLDVNLAFKFGQEVLLEEDRYLVSDGYWFGMNQANSGLDYWREPGDITETPKPIAYNSTQSSGYFSTRHMHEGDYLRIRNITLSYNVPSGLANRLSLENLRIYGSASNLFTFHDVPYFDPERGTTGVGFGIYPVTKKFSVGLELSF